MVSSEYRFYTHATLASSNDAAVSLGLPKALDNLSHAAFGKYDGVISGNSDFKRWFMSRSGMEDSSRFLAIHQGEIVSSLFVTVMPIRFDNRIITAGVIDSVMTHPDHRRKGLARELLTKAVAFMKNKRIDIAMLYTASESIPYHFYSSEGFLDYVRVQYLEIEHSNLLRRGRDSFRIVELDRPEIRDMLDRHYSSYWGYSPMAEKLWIWRRGNRPPHLPVWVYADKEEDNIEILFTLGQAPIRKAGRHEKMTMLNDYAGRGKPLDTETVNRILCKAPIGSSVITLCARPNVSEREAFLGAGFQVVGEEACMIKPLTDNILSVVKKEPPLWYTITESVVGI